MEEDTDQGLAELNLCLIPSLLTSLSFLLSTLVPSLVICIHSLYFLCFVNLLCQ